jgi:Skp family chaperone for outer membrane proteins
MIAQEIVMTMLKCLSVLALSLAPLAAAAATGDAFVGSKQIAMASDGPAPSGGLRQKGVQICSAAEIAVYSHDTGDFWCAVIR